MAVSYRQRGKKKLWDYRIIDKDKKVVASNSGFKTKREAQKEAIDIELKLIQGKVIDKYVTLYQLWERWYELMILPQKKSEGTLLKHFYRGKRIKDYFGDKPASEIKPSDYQAFINHYAQEISKDSISRLNSEIKSVITFAKRDKMNIDDFTLGAIITGLNNSKKVSDKYIASTADYKKLLYELERKVDYNKSVTDYFIYIQMKTGFRFGEVAGLTWDCILWEDLEIKTYRRYDTKKSKWTNAKTETSIRTVPIDNRTIEILKKLKREQEAYFKRYKMSNEENLLFIDFFTGVPTSQGINRSLRQTMEDINIKPKNLSSTGLRHTYASMMLSQDIDIWAIAKIMGHKDIKQITETYGHLIKEKEENENTKVRAFLGKG
ncbi:tyrosine-type recombinase/integrase [Streptococcus thoraltensis]|uniref:tyrosine-type recombinase/integrase n=1 Tax=Streptococcus thoraltensis TaxID=55085 RepID=UPI000377A737|nr:tyrosine-type recombinase/integrase [Streptococcus thoraltensis]